MYLPQLFAAIVLQAGVAVAAPFNGTMPTVNLDSATFVGFTNGSVSRFLGIPFAQPPIGDLRLRLPVPVSPYNGTHQATAFGLSCSQQSVRPALPSNLPADTLAFLKKSQGASTGTGGEDCLTLNVVLPANATPKSKLPVVVWIYGGGWEFGATRSFDGGPIVNRSIALGEPIIYVSMNYRVNGFGFLASKEVQDAGVGNLGLHDQREAFRWIQKYIGAFGGDPNKVTIWGESAGAISVGYHMVANRGKTDGLFRGAFMESGSPLSVGPLTDGQVYYDGIVAHSNCSGALDTLDCLRKLPFDTFKAAIDTSASIFSFQALKLAWVPRVDGIFLTENPQTLVKGGVIADVPFVNGDCDDEGTLFSFSTLNITTSAQLKTYLQTIWLPNASDRDVDELLRLYPDDITQGSPFDTGNSSALTPQFKRIAAFQGDAAFQAPRRFLLQHRSDKQAVWSFLSKRFKSVQVSGSAHGSDLLNVYGGGELADYLINFVANLDPNGKTQMYWPKYTNKRPKLLTFLDGSTPVEVSRDTFRQEAIKFVGDLIGSNPI